MREGDALGFIREACCDRNGSLALCQGVHLQHSRYSYSVLRICLQEIGDLISLEFWNGSLKAEFSTTCHKRSRNAQSSLSNRQRRHRINAAYYLPEAYATVEGSSNQRPRLRCAPLQGRQFERILLKCLHKWTRRAARRV